MANATARASVSFPILGILGIAFIVLKLCNVIAWSWVWVLAPFWIPVALVVVVLVIALAGWGITKLIPD